MLSGNYENRDPKIILNELVNLDCGHFIGAKNVGGEEENFVLVLEEHLLRQF